MPKNLLFSYVRERGEKKVACKFSHKKIKNSTSCRCACGTPDKSGNCQVAEIRKTSQ